MDPDDLLVLKLASLAAAVLVNLGRGTHPNDVIAQAVTYEASIADTIAATAPPE